nr:hypothetical protein [Enterococcus faecalis]
MNENTFLLSYYFTTKNKNTRAMFEQHFLCFFYYGVPSA